MTPEELKAAREACENATPGEWVYCETRHRGHFPVDNFLFRALHRDSKEGPELINGSFRSGQDGRFTALARTALPAALDFIEELLWTVYHVGASEVCDGDMKGWWDSCALSHVQEAADHLVALGKLERHPDGVGRRWFYRPIEKEKA